MEFSYIIAYKQTSFYREKNLKSILQWLSINSSKANFEIIIVEQDTEQKLCIDLPPNCKHIFVYNDSFFNKSWAFNIGAKASSSDILVFGDCDIIMDFKELLICVNACKNNKGAVDPKKYVLDTAVNEPDIFNPKRNSIRGSVVFAGGLFLIHKCQFYFINGWDEDMVGWGGEDDLMTHKIKSLIPNTELIPYKVYHLYHDISIRTPEVYENNLKILQKIRSMGSEQLIGYYKDKVIGDVHRYKQRQKE